MFSSVSNASKCALIHLIERLIIGKFDFIDTQFLNNHLKQFGAIEVPSSKFKSLLNNSINKTANFEKFSEKGFIGKEIYPLDLRKWFISLYKILFGSENGPRLGSFFSLHTKPEVLAILKKPISN